MGHRDQNQAEAAIRLLGPVRLVDPAGNDVPVGGQKCLAVLALLALESPNAVSRDRIVDAIWGDRPPPSVRNAVQVRISQLRAGLEHAFGARGQRWSLDLTRNAYRLVVAADAIDVARSNRLFHEARTLLDQDPERCEQLVRAAIGCWYGDALGGLEDCPFVETERPRLLELHIAAQELLFAARLSLGRAGECLPDLEGLVAAHPLRESLVVLHALALYREGRQADALGTLDDSRVRLDAALGLDPSPQAKAMRQRILRQSPDLLAGETVDHRPTPGRPTPVVRVPSPIDRIFGREEELADLERLLAHRRLVTVIGTGGAGKTRLAIEVARTDASHATRRRDVYFVDLSVLDKAEQVPAAVAAALGVTTTGTDIDEDLIAALDPSDTLLVLDNLEHVLDCADFLGRLLDRCPRLVVLATSREPTHLQGEQQFQLAPLAVPDADGAWDILATSPTLAFFADRATTQRHDFRLTPDNAGEIARLCAELDGLPLAIELAAAHSTMFSPAELRRRLGAGFDSLASTARGLAPRQQTLTATIEWSYTALTHRQQRVLRQLSVFRSPFTLEAAHHVLAPILDAASATAEISALLDKSLLALVSDDVRMQSRYRMLLSIREYAETQLNLAGEASSAGRLHTDYYEQLVRAPQPTEGDHVTLLQTIKHEVPDVRAVVDRALADPPHDPAIRIYPYLEVLDDLGYPADAETRVERALERTVQVDPDQVLLELLRVGLLQKEGRFAESRANALKALASARQLEEPSLLVQALLEASIWEFDSGSQMLDEATRLIARIDRGDTVVPMWKLRHSLNNATIGVWMFRDPPRAIRAARELCATAIIEAATARQWLGYLYNLTGRFRESEPLLAPYEEIAGRSGTPVAECGGLIDAAIMRFGLGQTDQAITDVEVAADWAERENHPVFLMTALSVLSDLHTAVGNHRAAEASLVRALRTDATGHVKQSAALRWRLHRMQRLRTPDSPGANIDSDVNALQAGWDEISIDVDTELPSVLAFLVERAHQIERPHPETSAMIVGAIEGRRGPFVLAPGCDLHLAALTRRLDARLGIENRQRYSAAGRSLKLVDAWNASATPAET